MDWLRLWHDMPNDPKWRTIARYSKQRIGDVIGVYVHLLVTASACKDRGSVGAVNPEDLGSALDLELDQVEAILLAMQGRVIQDGRLSGWDTRQPLREDGATTARGKPSDNYVYFVATTNSDVVKIGVSRNPWSRAKDLQTGNSEKFAVLATIKTPNRSEFDVHGFFAQSRKEGEWFYRSEALNSLISKIKDKSISDYEDLTSYLKGLPLDDYAPLRSYVVTTKEKIREDEIKNKREAKRPVDKSDTENRATRLSLDFEFPESWQAWARTARAEVKDPKAVFRKFITLYADGEAKPPEVWTSMFRSFLLNERIPVDPATAVNEDPDTRPNVEKRGVAVGIGKWDDCAEQWPQYKARVQAAEREAEPHGA